MIRICALAVLVLATSACGRLGFDLFGDNEPAPPDGSADASDTLDARACTPVGHDEDEDGVDDACDVCPHLPVSHADRDGDGVGDLCDPNPDLPVDRIEFFDTFVTGDPSWTFAVPQNISFEDGDLRVRDDAVMRRPITDGVNTFAFNGVVRQQLMPGALILMLTAGDANYYCEVQVGGGYTQLTTELQPDIFVALDNEPLGNTVLAGRDVAMSMSLDDRWSCASTLGADAYVLDALRPVEITPDQLVLQLYDLEIDVKWFIHIRSDI